MTYRQLKVHFDTALPAYSSGEVKSIFFQLLRHVLKIVPSQYLAKAGSTVPPSDLAVFLSLLDRLQKHEPLQYILGETEFYGLILKVNQYTLIPRPETEELVELIRAETKITAPSILDVGTGSGCILLGLKKAIPAAVGVGIDISKEALEVARYNALKYRMDVIFKREDILKSRGEATTESYDLIVSNPPYIREEEKEEMHPNVLQYEPHTALFVKDTDPLRFYRAIEEKAASCLLPEGRLFLEVNQSLARETLALFNERNWRGRIHRDLSGHDRFLEIAHKKSPL